MGGFEVLLASLHQQPQAASTCSAQCHMVAQLLATLLWHSYFTNLKPKENQTREAKTNQVSQLPLLLHQTVTELFGHHTRSHLPLGLAAHLGHFSKCDCLQQSHGDHAPEGAFVLLQSESDPLLFRTKQIAHDDAKACLQPPKYLPFGCTHS